MSTWATYLPILTLIATLISWRIGIHRGYSDGTTDAVALLRDQAKTHRDGPCEAVRRKTLNAAANELDRDNGRAFDREIDRAYRAGAAAAVLRREVATNG